MVSWVVHDFSNRSKHLIMQRQVTGQRLSLDIIFILGFCTASFSGVRAPTSSTNLNKFQCVIANKTLESNC